MIFSCFLYIDGKSISLFKKNKGKEAVHTNKEFKRKFTEGIWNFYVNHV